MRGGKRKSAVKMPSITPPVDSKSRQSSGGRSFFGRKNKDKDKDARDRAAECTCKNHEHGALCPPEPINSAANSITGRSRHSHRPSEHSIDMDHAHDGLSLTSGVITSIPYDSLSADSRTPVTVDYLPRNDQTPTRREPLPHHLNKGGTDFHQYPAWETNSSANGASHPTGPRPPPHGAPSTLSTYSTSSVSSRNKLQPLGRPGTSTSMANGSLGTINSYTTTDSTRDSHRNSFDHASIYSTVSSATRGSSIFSSDNSSRTAVPQHLQDSRPGSSYSSNPRQSNAGWHPQPKPGYHATVAFNPDGFVLERPANDAEVEEQFIRLMHKRGWQNLPDQARRQMLAYPAAKKWTLVHQDRLTEWQGEQKRRLHARQTLGDGNGQLGILGRADEEGSPEWFVRKVLDDSITAKQLQSLSVSLRTQPIR